jgi:hypothetical protein
MPDSYLAKLGSICRINLDSIKTKLLKNLLL